MATFSLRQSAKQIRSDRSSDGIYFKRPSAAGVCCEVSRVIGWATLIGEKPNRFRLKFRQDLIDPYNDGEYLSTSRQG
jgi:hypothetical protein